MRDRRAPNSTVEPRCSSQAGSVCVDTSTRREPSAFEQNTGYTTHGCGRGRRRRYGLGGAGAHAGAGASAGMLAEAVRKH